MPPFRFGVQLSKADSAVAWRATARKIEDLGYSSLFIPDHFDDQYGPLVALTAAAEATTTLRVGSLVFDNDYRHPVVLAKEVATLDLFSEGRRRVRDGRRLDDQRLRAVGHRTGSARGPHLAHDREPGHHEGPVVERRGELPR